MLCGHELFLLQLVAQLEDFDLDLALAVVLEDVFVGLSLPVLERVEVLRVGFAALVLGSEVRLVALDVAGGAAASGCREAYVGCHGE